MAYMKRSPWIIHYDGSSCNGCDIEVLACLTPLYDVERFGIINTGNPKHADIFVVTGSVNEQNTRGDPEHLRPDARPEGRGRDRDLRLLGRDLRASATTSLGGMDKVIPVDVYVPGCAARPEPIIDGVVKALGVLEEKRARMKAGAPAEVTA